MIAPAASHPQPPRPQWRDEYLRDGPALFKHCKEVRAWQRRSGDAFERADAELWSRVKPEEAWSIFFELEKLFCRWDQAGELDATYAIENEARRAAGVSPLTMTEFRVTLARILFHLKIFRILPAMEV
jgi:hypothetical protein